MGLLREFKRILARGPSSTAFVCHVREQLPEETTEEIRAIWRETCKGLGFYGEYDGHQYCVLHFPSEDKKDDFKKVLDFKLLESRRAQKDYNFGGTFFQRAPQTSRLMNSMLR